MANSKTLSPSHIRYLLAMQELDQHGRGVRCSDIATALGLSKPSVHNMMNTFIDFGLVRKDAYGAAFFTERGVETARRYRRYYEAVEWLLRQGFPAMEEMQTAACSLLAQIPERDLEELSHRRAALDGSPA